MSDEFYIGYLDGKPDKMKKLSRMFMAFGLLVCVIVPAWILINQSEGEPTTYKFGTTEKVEGVLTLGAAPMLHTSTESIILVGFGKHKLLDEGFAEGATVVVDGTWIRGKGKSLMEVQEGAISKTGVGLVPSKYKKGTLTLSGKIIDPKCYFGAMNPGEGKTHRACAIRCISGGIPPVLEVRTEKDFEYFVLTDKNGNPVNEQVLDYVDIPIEVSGNWQEFGNWNLLEIDPEKISLL